METSMVNPTSIPARFQLVSGSFQLVSSPILVRSPARFQLVSKGKFISKWFFGVIDFLQKTNERIRLYYYDTSGRLVFVRFLEEIDDPKKPFRN